MNAMSHANYTHGFSGGVAIRGMPVLNSYSKNVHWVDSGGSANGAGTFQRPYTTIDQAINHCSAGDIIMVKEGHSETLTGASAITCDVAGVSIIGLGSYSRRPRLLLDGGTTVDIAVSAADVTWQNIVFAAGHADIVRAFNVTAKGAAFIGCEFVDNVATENFLTPIKATSTTNNNADGLTVVGCKFLTPDAATLEFIEVNADIFGMVVRDNVVVHEGTDSPLVRVATGKDLQYTEIVGNFLSHKMTANELLVNCDTNANSGIIAHNRVGHADVTSTHDLGIDGLGCRLFDNLSASTDSVSGFVLPQIDANS